MARRPVFIPLDSSDHLVEEVELVFEWSPGFAPVQKKKNVAALHDVAKQRGLHPLLEVSTKSEEELGQRLSAFSLRIPTEVGEISIEAAYQGSKVFQQGGPFTDIYEKNSREAKKDPRIRESGQLIGFNYFGKEWPLIPLTAFYDWLYLTALRPHQEWLRRLFVYKGFTDIEFNPQRSINCQARTCALLVSLLHLNLLDEALRSQEHFIDMVSSDSRARNRSAEPRKGQLF